MKTPSIQAVETATSLRSGLEQRASTRYVLGWGPVLLHTDQVTLQRSFDLPETPFVSSSIIEPVCKGPST